MKKALSKTIIIVACVVAVLAVAVLVLCLVSLDPVKTLDGYDRVEVYNLSSSDRIEITADKADQKAKLDEAIDKTSFSVMQGILEGKASVSYKFKTEVKEGETNESRVEIAAEDIASVAATDTLYKLVFVFPACVTKRRTKKFLPNIIPFPPLWLTRARLRFTMPSANWFLRFWPLNLLSR